MSIVKPEIEYVDRATETIRYLEHGWPTELCRWHSHPEYELHLIVETRGRAFVGDYIGEFQPGSLFLTGSDLPHNWVTDKVEEKRPVPLRDMLVQFSEDNLVQLRQAFPEFNELSPMLGLAASGIEFAGFELATARGHLEAIRDSQGANRILAFLEFLVRIDRHKDKKALSVVSKGRPVRNSVHHRIANVVDHIARNFSENVSVGSAAEMAGMSKTSFARNFQLTTGNHFIEFVNRVRIGQACSMLYATDESVSYICYTVGFQNIANFNRQFRRFKQLTPSAYRELARRDLATKGLEKHDRN